MIWEIAAEPAMIKADVIDEVSRVLQIPRHEAEAMLEAVLVTCGPAPTMDQFFGGKVTCHLAPAMRCIIQPPILSGEEHMKRLLACVVLLLGSAGLAAADDWVGWLSDAKCATAAKAVSDGHADCAKTCVDGGEAIVLVIEADKKVYKLDSQDKAKPHLGKKVTVTGALDGETIKVEDIKT